jgi:hypothetical protein
MSDLPKGTPLVPPYECIPVPGKPYANDIKYRATGKIMERRWWSGSDEQKIKDAILLLTCADMGFSVSINAPAYKVSGAKHNYSDHSVLSIIRTGYGSPYYGPKDYWTVSFNGFKLEKFDDPEKAIEFFMQKRMEYEIGEDMADMGFCGHGTPQSVIKAMEEETS